METTNQKRFSQIEITQEDDTSFTAENIDEMSEPTANFLLEKAAQKWAQYKIKNTSPIIDIIGQMTPIGQCTSCMKTTATTENFLVLNVPITPGVATHTLEDLMKNIFETTEKKVDETCADPRGPVCGLAGHVNWRQLEAISHAPHVLITQLMRFRREETSEDYFKLNTPVQITTADLNLPVLRASQKATYTLIGAVAHLGAKSARSGHYVSYAEDSEKWYEFDDEVVTPVNIDNELKKPLITCNGYVLFYKKV